MTINNLITQMRNAPVNIEFTEVIQVISEYYTYTPTGFNNGTLHNSAGSNEGSCKIFYFAQIHGLSETETLGLFGRYYREDVLTNPSGDDHGNIRNFMLTGWRGIAFDEPALSSIVK